ncbi:sigma-54-dependent transcriptional regulator [Elongatibacter sediminis]|uniref:Sigma-54 dependent transcriptional regulator n=1 Tax=Elongatibacter sediminis TaxID=3119006 RepID=A0AAW9R8L4_9GAMM
MLDRLVAGGEHVPSQDSGVQTEMAHVLIVDDESAFADGLAEYLEVKGHSASAVGTLADARDAVSGRVPDVVMLDLMLPDGSGLELLDSLADEQPKRIVIMTGHSGVKSLIGGMAGQGVTYLKKPIEPRDVSGILATLGDDSPPAEADSNGAGTGHFGLLLGESEAMQSIYDQIRRVGTTDSTVLVQGESGTGKELVAEAIHRVSGQTGPFVPVNCGGLSRDLVSSQLFGHEKGAFTGADQRHAGFFERAKDGTLFLDEITEMPLETQTHLLRVLETRKVLRLGSEREIPVNARLIAATNRNPAEAVGDGELREDLYFRLRVFPIELPPLRERKGDVRLLAHHFLTELNEQNGTAKQFSDTALDRLEKHLWPGNVRELKHTVHRAYILAESDVVETPDRFDEDLPGGIEGISVGRSIADVEKDLILSTVEHFKGDKKAAAAVLGVSLKTLYNRMKSYEEAG